MSTVVTHSPANQDRPLLPRRSSDQRRIRTLLDLLTIEKMDGPDHTTMTTTRHEEGNHHHNNSNSSRWRNLRERLGLKAIGCCGIATWHSDNNSSFTPEEIVDENNLTITTTPTTNDVINNGVTRQQGEEEVGPTNLAAALAAERQYRSNNNNNGVDDDVVINTNNYGGGDATPSRVSLMRLLEETSDGCDLERERLKSRSSSSNGGGGGSGDNDRVCCVCMGREKGAAFIPCGHTYCRVCSRELWLNRGSCPLCNRRILEILDIF